MGETESNYKTVEKCDFQLKIDGEEDVFKLNIVTDYTFRSTESVIKIESATGDGGVTYANGRKQESVPISGTLLANTKEELRSKETKLIKLKDDGEVVELMSPFKIKNRTNKYIIESIEFNKKNATPTSTPFSMVLTEKRSANVKTTSANLVNYQSAKSMKDYYNSLMGNI